MEQVEKTWGYEIWFANTARYCGKLLFVRHDEWSSKGAYHYHKIKDETFFIVEGVLRLDYVDNNENFQTVILNKHEAFHVPTQMKHRFTAISESGCRFVEASTTHRDEDSYRVHWNEDHWVQA